MVVMPQEKHPTRMLPRRNPWRFPFSGRSLAPFCLGLLLGYPVLAQTQQLPATPGPAGATGTASPTCTPDTQPQQRTTGTIRGLILDPNGTGVSGADVILTREDEASTQEIHAGEDGQFSFVDIAPGPFRLSITSAGFAPQTASGSLHSAESCIVPQITMALATNVTEVRVELSTIELAQEQIRDQEKQRVLGIIPNFYVTYVPDAAPLTPKQKFQLAWKSTVDPVSFAVTGVIAGVQQATNDFSGYGQGAQGYAKRYGASYADLVTGTFIGGAILPSLLKQDPRYFYKGTGSVRSRVLYAVANSVICKGDNGHWQPNYSGIIGSLASGGISNLYYPSTDRAGAALTFENMLLGIGETAAVNLLQEFVMRRLTPNLPNFEPATP
jgi:Carboxypeptidase regulatory-like domain